MQSFRSFLRLRNDQVQYLNSDGQFNIWLSVNSLKKQFTL